MQEHITNKWQEARFRAPFPSQPDARNETHAHVQPTVYSLALARRTGLPLRFFKCGWFDEKCYFDFYLLQGVYKRRDRR